MCTAQPVIHFQYLALAHNYEISQQILYNQILIQNEDKSIFVYYHFIYLQLQKIIISQGSYYYFNHGWHNQTQKSPTWRYWMVELGQIKTKQWLTSRYSECQFNNNKIVLVHWYITGTICNILSVQILMLGQIKKSSSYNNILFPS